MRYVTKADDDLIMTLNLMTHFPSRESQMLKQLEGNYQANPADSQAAVAYALFKYMSLTKVAQDFDIAELDLFPVLEVYDTVLKGIPDYWMVKFFKTKLMLKIPDTYRDQTAFEKLLEEMILEQEQATRQEPYFIAPYIIYADHMYSAKKPEQAQELLTAGYQRVPQRPLVFQYLGQQISMLAKDFYNRLIYSNDTTVSAVMQRLSQVYFPEEKIFQTPTQG